MRTESLLKSFEFALNKIEDFRRSKKTDRPLPVTLSLDLIAAGNKLFESLESGSETEKALAIKARMIAEEYNASLNGEEKEGFILRLFKKLTGKAVKAVEPRLHKIHWPQKLTLKKRKVQHTPEEAPLSSYLKVVQPLNDLASSLYMMKAILLLEKHFGATSKEARELVRAFPYTLHKSSDEQMCFLIHTLYPFGTDTIVIEAEFSKNSSSGLFSELNSASLQLHYHSRQTGFPTPLQADGFVLSEHLIGRDEFEKIRGNLQELLHPSNPDFAKIRSHFNQKKASLQNDFSKLIEEQLQFFEALTGKKEALTIFFKQIGESKNALIELERFYLQLRSSFIDHPAAFLKSRLLENMEGFTLEELLLFQKRTLEEIRFDAPVALVEIAKALIPSFSRLLLHPYQKIELQEVDLKLLELTVAQAKKFASEVRNCL